MCLGGVKIGAYKKITKATFFCILYYIYHLFYTFFILSNLEPSTSPFASCTFDKKVAFSCLFCPLTCTKSVILSISTKWSQSGEKLEKWLYSGLGLHDLHQPLIFFLRLFNEQEVSKRDLPPLSYSPLFSVLLQVAYNTTLVLEEQSHHLICLLYTSDAADE